MSALDLAWAELWAEAERATCWTSPVASARASRRLPPVIGPARARSGAPAKTASSVSQKKGFLCRPSGAHGDAVDMAMHISGGTRKEALAYVTGKSLPGEDGTQPTQPQRPTPQPSPARPARKEAAKPATTTAQAITLFRQGVDPRGTCGRCISTRSASSTLALACVAACCAGIRASARCSPYFATSDRRAAGGQRTFLDRRPTRSDANSPARSGGAAVMLDPFDDVVERPQRRRGRRDVHDGAAMSLRPVMGARSDGRRSRHSRSWAGSNA